MAGTMTGNPLVGMWRLTGFERIGPDGERTAGTNPHGCLVYSPDGWLTESFSIDMPGGTRTVIYCGSYRVDGDTVYHRPAFHADQALIGQDLPRGFTVDPDGQRFILIGGTPDAPIHLHWERIEVA